MQADAALAGPRLIERCPLDCASVLQPTAIMLPEGPLRRCPQCQLLLSSCTSAQHEAALGTWDTDRGTLPDERSAQRFRKVTRRRLCKALRLVRGSAPMRLLDVGCSSGSLLEIAAEIGFSVAGVEPALAAASAARRAGFDVFTGRLQDAGYAAQSFDVITLIELIEHVTDPLDLLRTSHHLLRPGGAVLINTPNPASWSARVMGSRWLGFSLTGLGGHICFYSPAAVRVLAQRTGFEVASISTRHVRLVDKGERSAIVYRFGKIAAEALAQPARWLGAGHDMLAILKRPH